MPPHSITTLSLTPTTVHTTPHHGTHNTPRNHACVLWCLLFACRCLCVSLSARSFLTQPKPRHAIQSPYPQHMTPPMHEPISEWEGAVVRVCGHHSPNTSHHNQVTMPPTPLALFPSIHWPSTLFTTPPRQRSRHATGLAQHQHTC